MLAYLTSRLRLKLVLLVVAGIVAGFTLIGSFRIHSEQQNISQEMQRSAQERVELIAQAVANLVVGYDYSNMESLADRIVSEKDVLHLIVRGNAGKIMVERSRPGTAKHHARKTLTFISPVTFANAPVGKVELTVSLERMEEKIASTLRNIVLEQIFFGLFLGLIIFLATSHVIVRPVTRLNQHMKNMLTRGAMSSNEPIEASSRDELGDLTKVFNALIHSLFEARARLQEKIDLTGSELMRTNEALQQRTHELERTLGLVERLAGTDSLTDLCNRREFDSRLTSAFANAHRSDENICLILLDIDHFKQINDTYGHAAGDEVLKTLASTFRGRLREGDTAGRLGGDEFAILLHHATIEAGRLFAEEVLALVHEIKFHFNRMDVHVGLSIGIASTEHSHDIHSIEALYGAADQALYEAKRRGRKQVVSFPYS